MRDSRKYSTAKFLNVEKVGDEVFDKKVVEVEEDGKYEKPILVFSDGTKLSLNNTNRETMEKNYGFDMDGWIGVKVRLAVGELTFNNKPTPSVILTPITPPKLKKVKADMQRPIEDESAFDNEGRGVR